MTEAMLDAVKPDVLDIITPPPTHLAAITRRACPMPSAISISVATACSVSSAMSPTICGTALVNSGRDDLANLRIEEAAYESDRLGARIALS